MEILEAVYWDNTVRDYLVAGGVAVGIVLAVRIAVLVILKRVQRLAARTETSLDDTIIRVLSATRMILALVVALYAGSLFLIVPAEAAGTFQIAAVIAVLLQIGVWTSAGLTAAVERLREKKAAAGDTSGMGVLAMIGLFGRVVAWAIVVLLVLDNLGVDITALVAGLGIGGIAIALAVQSVLQDVLASVSIMLDKPFEVGDTVHVGDMIGTVENIGIKTTRLRALSGEQLVLSNNDLLGSRIRNYKRMRDRRVVLVVGVTYQTPIATLEKLADQLRALVEKEKAVRFDRAHLRSFGASSLEFEVVYYITTADYGVFMDTQQRVNLDILRR